MLGEGKQLAGYTVVRFLGAGGMGEVYLAQHPRLPRRRDALKLLGRDISADRNFRDRFLREADLASTLSHQHIVGVHDRGEDRGQLWIAMDYIDGEDAGQLLRRRYPAGMPVELVSAILTAVASALDYAHSRGLLHRDVKPANILLSNADDPAQRRILLTDFGIARALDDISDLTPTNTTLGTVAYSAPEQLMGQELDGCADQYSLAATAYQLLTGTTMFPQSNAAVVIGHHLNALPPALSKTRRELAGLDPVLRAALAKKPQDRFASCTDFARAFAEQAAAGTPSPSDPTAPAPKPRNPQRDANGDLIPESHGSRQQGGGGRTILLTLGVVVVVFVVLGALVELAGKDRPEDTSSQIAAPSAPATSAASTPPPSSSPPPPPPTPVTPSAAPPRLSPTTVVDSVLLTPDELSRTLGVKVTTDAGADYAVPALKLTASSYGPTDHARQVTPPACVGLIFTGDNRVYGDSPVEKMKTESFASVGWSPTYYGPRRLEQTVAVFPSAADAQKLFAAQQRQWNACANPAQPLYPKEPAIDIHANLGYEQQRGFVLGNVQRDTNIMTMPMASNDGLNGPDACQEAMGIRDNIIVEARTCHDPRLTLPPTVQADPSWAAYSAHMLVGAMLNRIA